MGSIIPRQQCNVSLILAQTLPSAFIFNSSVETKGPVSAASENQAMGAWPSPAASHTYRVCVSRARADVQTHQNGGVEKRGREQGKEAWQRDSISDSIRGIGPLVMMSRDEEVVQAMWYIRRESTKKSLCQRWQTTHNCFFNVKVLLFYYYILFRQS